MRDVATFIALNRFGLGAVSGEAGTSVATRAAGCDADRPARGAGHGRRARLGRRLGGDAPRRDRGTRTAARTARRLYSSVFGPEIVARARHAIATEQPFAERMALFWSNHFTVSRTRAIVGPAIPAYEREAIRPYVFGRFADMLKAVCRHPCMLEYLDNIVSIGPRSEVGRLRLARAGRRPNPQREPRPRNPRAAHARRERRLWPTGRDRTRQGDQRLEPWGLSPPQDPRPVEGGFEFQAERSMSPARRPCWAGPTPKPARTKVSRCWTISRAILRRRSIWRRSWSAISSPTIRRRTP